MKRRKMVQDTIRFIMKHVIKIIHQLFTNSLISKVMNFVKIIPIYEFSD